MASASKNHERAPEMAKWVKLMREVFGDDVRVLWVKEGEFEIGEQMAGSHSWNLGGREKKKGTTSAAAGVLQTESGKAKKAT